MSLHNLAQHLQSAGRNGDSMLVHMTPGEVNGLQQLAMAHGASLSINPKTGLPEANILAAILPSLFGAAFGPAGFIKPLFTSQLATSLAGGLIGTLATGSLSKGIMAGLGAYGGSSLGGSLSEAGAKGVQQLTPAQELAQKAVGQGAVVTPSGLVNPNLAQRAMAATTPEMQQMQANILASPVMQTGSNLSKAPFVGEGSRIFANPMMNQALQQAATSTTAQAALDGGLASMGRGLEQITKSPAALMQFAEKNINPLLATAASIQAGMQQDPRMPEAQKSRPIEITEYQYGAPTGAIGSAERNYFPGAQFAPTGRYYGKEGGLMSLANGGTVEEMSRLNAIGANTMYPMANQFSQRYATAAQRPISENVVRPEGDSRLDPYTGEMRFSNGGSTDALRAQVEQALAKSAGTTVEAHKQKFGDRYNEILDYWTNQEIKNAAAGLPSAGTAQTLGVALALPSASGGPAPGQNNIVSAPPIIDTSQTQALEQARAATAAAQAEAARLRAEAEARAQANQPLPRTSADGAAPARDLTNAISGDGTWKVVDTAKPGPFENFKFNFNPVTGSFSPGMAEDLTRPASAAQVADLYERVLGRQPDLPGLTYYTATNRMPASRVEAMLRDSPEYFESLTKPLVPRALYNNTGMMMLEGGVPYNPAQYGFPGPVIPSIPFPFDKPGGPFLPPGGGGGGGNVPSGPSGPSVDPRIEAIRGVVSSWYGTYAGRAADPTGLQYWTDQIMSGRMTTDQALAKFREELAKERPGGGGPGGGGSNTVTPGPGGGPGGGPGSNTVTPGPGGGPGGGPGSNTVTPGPGGTTTTPGGGYIRWTGEGRPPGDDYYWVGGTMAGSGYWMYKPPVGTGDGTTTTPGGITREQVANEVNRWYASAGFYDEAGATWWINHILSSGRPIAEFKSAFDARLPSTPGGTNGGTTTTPGAITTSGAITTPGGGTTTPSGGIQQSPEQIRESTRGILKTYLGREPDASMVDYWSGIIGLDNQLSADEIERIRNAVVIAGEAGAPVAPGIVPTTPAPSTTQPGVNAPGTFLGSDNTLKTVEPLKLGAGSVEQQTRDLLRQGLGSEPDPSQVAYWSGIFGQDNKVEPDEIARLQNAFTIMRGGAAGGSVPSGLAALGGYSDGGRLLKGPGDGVSDSIPAVIGNRQPARLADGEFVVPARIVSELGNGSTDAGARKLYAMMDRIQRARKKSVGKNRVAVNSKADKHLPA